MKRIALTTVLFTLGVAAYAETQPAPAPPAIVSDVQASAQDSPLVQAAKRALAKRRSGASAIPVITNATVANSTGVLSTSSGGAAVAYIPSSAAPAVQSAPTYPVSRAAQSGYALQAASDPSLPQISQNASSGSAPGMAQNAGYAATTPRTVQNAAGAPQPTATPVATLPRTVMNTAYAPAPAQNTAATTTTRP